MEQHKHDQSVAALLVKVVKLCWRNSGVVILFPGTVASTESLWWGWLQGGELRELGLRGASRRRVGRRLV